MKWEDSNVTLPVSNPNELQSLIAKNAVMLKIPAKTVFLEPGSKPEGVYYVASGRTRHYMIAQDGSEKILFFPIHPPVRRKRLCGRMSICASTGFSIT